MELLGATIYLADRYPRPLSDFFISESDEGVSATQPRILVVDDERLLADTTAATGIRRTTDITEAITGGAGIGIKG